MPKPTHLVATSDATHTLCGIRRKSNQALPYLLAAFREGFHVDYCGVCEQSACASTTDSGIVASPTLTNPKGERMSIDFGDPVPVTELPEPSSRGGRPTNIPALEKWVKAVAASNAGTYELRSNDQDGGHPAPRVTQLRKVIGKLEIPNVTVETRPVETGKRYRIFAIVAEADAKAKAS